ncbi:Fibronectin type III domain-containing protein [hydrothermal vent metagenome]|uniref:Fibronectin type III domain-containing protein n=1 Tax=hydrothermal vent metagenome TaxID=652676 RepID=A0A3B1C5Z0_9ZZZZ
MKWGKLLLVGLLPILLIGCDNNVNIFYDNTPPATPINIRTITGDNMVEINWDPVYSSDLAGYAVYYSYSYDGKYSLIGITERTQLIDYGAENGITIYYAVASYDVNGNESKLSYDVAYDTPRPEGYNNRIYDYKSYPNLSGYNFASYKLTAYNSDYTDFFVENDNGVFYLNVWEDTDIQDMGPTYNIYDITEAPLTGWVEQLPGANIKYVRAYTGHTYVVWTWDNHFAKIRVQNIDYDRLTFDWAYQTAEGNVELKINRNGESRIKLPDKVVK